LLNKLVFENLKHRPVRTLLGILAIGVEVTMILTLVGLSRGMLEDSANRARGIGADVLVRPPGTSVIGLSTAPMNDKLVPFVQNQPHVTFAMGTMVYPLGGVTTITGLDLEQFERLSGGFNYLSGGPFTGADDEVLVDEFYAQQSRLRVGDTVNLLNRDWRVVGILGAGKLARVVVPLKRLQELTGNEGKLSQIFLKVDSPENIDAVVTSLRQRLENYPIYSMEEFTSLLSVDNVPGLKAFIYVVIGIGVVVGFLIVFLSTYTSVLERTREIGVLKALGASPVFVINLIFRETFVLAMLGSIAGILFSFVTRWVIQIVVPYSLVQVIVPDWWPIAAIISLVGAALGASYPGWRAARQDPIEALAYD
jgi:putative ABC transport system permease protein